MKFKTVAEAFNYYRNKKITEIESRAAEIKTIVDTDPNIDIESINIELEGLRQAKLNIEERSQEPNKFNLLGGMKFGEHTEEIADKDIFSSKEYRTAFFKSLLGQKLETTEENIYNRAMNLIASEKRADAFSTSTSAAAILPTQTLNEIITKARTEGGLIGQCRGFNIPSKISIPIATPSMAATWHTEGLKVDSEEPTLTNITFDGYEIIKIFSISAKAKTMSIQGFESYITEELYKCVMECINNCIVNGTGTNQGTGILKGVTFDTKNSIEYTTNLKYTDFTKAISLLKRGYGANAKFAMNNATLYSQVYSIVDTQNRPIFITDPKNEKIGYILGKQVIVDDNIADDTIILGDFKYMGYNMPEGIMIEVSRESSFKSGLIDYRAMAIADTKPILQEAFIKISKKAV